LRASRAEGLFSLIKPFRGMVRKETILVLLCNISRTVQAAIAAVHDEAARAEDTDWPQILALYDLLNRMSDNPTVILNGAVAAAMVHGTTKGLELLDAVKSRLVGGPIVGRLPR
jgi:predicted RNA polymerase sigma factor